MLKQQAVQPVFPHGDAAGWKRYLAVAPYFIKMKIRVGAAIPKGTALDGALVLARRAAEGGA